MPKPRVSLTERIAQTSAAAAADTGELDGARPHLAEPHLVIAPAPPFEQRDDDVLATDTGPVPTTAPATGERSDSESLRGFSRAALTEQFFAERPAEPITVGAPVREVPKPFSIQIAEELDRMLRAEVVRRTDETGRAVPIAELVHAGFSATAVPADVADVETLVSRLSDAMANGSIVATSVRVDTETRRRLASLKARLREARSPVTMHAVYTALILNGLGQLPKRTKR